jgi:mRNA-binding protein PUF3
MENTPNKQAYVEALRPQLQWARNSNYSGKHVERISELLRETSPARREDATPSTRHSSIAPSSPLQLDVGSAAPTPNLTMEPNSPSSSPPSTTESAVDEPVGVTLKGQMASADGISRVPEVRVEE